MKYLENNQCYPMLKHIVAAQIVEDFKVFSDKIQDLLIMQVVKIPIKPNIFCKIRLLIESDTWKYSTMHINV